MGHYITYWKSLPKIEICLTEIRVTALLKGRAIFFLIKVKSKSIVNLPTLTGLSAERTHVELLTHITKILVFKVQSEIATFLASLISWSSQCQSKGVNPFLELRNKFKEALAITVPWHSASAWYQKISIPYHRQHEHFYHPLPSKIPRCSTPQCSLNSKIFKPPLLWNFWFILRPFGIPPHALRIPVQETPFSLGILRCCLWYGMHYFLETFELLNIFFGQTDQHDSRLTRRDPVQLITYLTSSVQVTRDNMGEVFFT